MAELVTQPTAGDSENGKKTGSVPPLKATPPAVTGAPAGSVSNRLGSKVLSSLGSVSNRLMGGGSSKPSNAMQGVAEEIVVKPADGESLAMPQIALQDDDEAASESKPRISKAAPPPRARPSSSNLTAADRRSQAGRSSRRLSAAPLLEEPDLLRERDPGSEPTLGPPASAAAAIANALPAPLLKCLPCLANMS